MFVHSWGRAACIALIVMACSPSAAPPASLPDVGDGASALDASVGFDAAVDDAPAPADDVGLPDAFAADAPDVRAATDVPGVDAALAADVVDAALAADVVDAGSDVGPAADVVDAGPPPCREDRECGLGNYCAGGSCARQLCPPDARECVDTGRRRACDARGIAWTDTACGDTEVCTGGNCVARACAPNVTDCLNATTRRTCAADGLRFTTAACPSTDLCSGGMCVARTCAVGSATCLDGTTRRVCNSSGSGYDTAPCPTGQGCADGACRAFVCTPDAATCASTTERSVCAANGLSLTRTACMPMQSCRDGACANWVCPPNTATCTSPTERSVCAADGLSSAPSACPTGTTCSGGICGQVADACPGVEVVPDGAPLRVRLDALRLAADATRCTLSPPRDWVARFTLSQTRDVRVVASGSPGALVSMVLRRGDCAAGSGPYGCMAGSVVSQTFRALEPGEYFLVIAQATAPSSGDEGIVVVTTTAPAARPVGDGCFNPVDVTVNGPESAVTTTGFDAFSEQASFCGTPVEPPANRADVFWRFRTNETRDVRLDLSGCAGTLRVYTGCGSARRAVDTCDQGLGSTNPVIFREWLRALPAGEYIVAASTAAPGGTCSLRVTSTAPGVFPPGDSCAAPIDVPTDGTPTRVTFDERYALGAEPGSGCIVGTTYNDIFLRFRLTDARDVTINVPTALNAAFALRPGCGEASGYYGHCFSSTETFRGLPAGEYIIEINRTWTAAALTAPVTVTASVPPLRLTGDTCATAVPVGLDGIPAAVTLAGTTPTADVRAGVSCSSNLENLASTGTDVYFTFDLPDTRDVEVNVDAPGVSGMEIGRGCGHHIVGARLCRAQGRSHNIVAPRLPPGRYYIAVGGNAVTGTVGARVTTAPPGTRLGYGVFPTTTPAVATCTRDVLTTGTGSLTVTVPFDLRFFGRTVRAGSPALLTAAGALVLDNATPGSGGTSVGQAGGPDFAIIGNLDPLVRMAGACHTVSGVAPGRRWNVSWFYSYRDSFDRLITDTLTGVSIEEQTGVVTMRSNKDSFGLEDMGGRPFIAPPSNFYRSALPAARLVPFP